MRVIQTKKERYFLIAAKYELKTDKEVRFMSYVIRQAHFPNIPQVVNDVKQQIKNSEKIFPISITPISHADFMSWQKGTEHHTKHNIISK